MSKLIVATTLSELRFELAAGSTKGTERHKTCPIRNPRPLGNASLWMRRVMFAQPVTSVVIVSVSWCWPPAHDELQRLQNHCATRRLGDEDFLLAIA